MSFEYEPSSEPPDCRHPANENGNHLLVWKHMRPVTCRTPDSIPVRLANYSKVDIVWYDKLRVGWPYGGGGAQDKKMSKGHLPRVEYYQVHNVYGDKLVHFGAEESLGAPGWWDKQK